MKEPLRLPFVFLLVFLCATVVLTSLQLFAGWGLEDSEVRRFTFELAVARLPRALFEVMLPAVLLSIVLLGFRMVRRPFSRLLGFLIVLGVSYAVLVNGMIWSHRAESGVRQSAGTPVSAQYLQPGSFTAVGTRYVAPRSLKGDSLGPLLVVDPARKAPRFTLYTSGTVSTKDGIVSLQLAGAKPLSLREEMRPATTPLFGADRFTDLFLRDFRVMTKDLRELLIRSPGRFLVACFALLFLVSASLSLLRVTRWPLFNVLLLVLAVRAYLLLYHVLAVDFAPTIGRVVSDPLLALLAPSAAFIVLGVLLLLVDILFIPPERWTTEAGR
ncbi:MAG: hypothetical protein NTU62_03050 [Spirochaetes bacterium]|nr:hypothetical protein [Spirochaetota bacterium]